MNRVNTPEMKPPAREEARGREGHFQDQVPGCQSYKCPGSQRISQLPKCCGGECCATTPKGRSLLSICQNVKSKTSSLSHLQEEDLQSHRPRVCPQEMLPQKPGREEKEQLKHFRHSKVESLGTGNAILLSISMGKVNHLPDPTKIISEWKLT